MRIDPSDPLGSAENARSSYERTGAPELLELGLSLIEIAYQAAPAASWQRADALRLRGVLLRLRYERTRDRADLDAAVKAGRQALAAPGPQGAVRANVLSSLGSSLQEVFMLTNDEAAIEEAATLTREAWNEVAGDPGFRHRAALQGTLSNALLLWGKASGRDELIAEAVAAGREAVRATPEGDPAGPRLLVNLGTALMFHARSSGGTAAVDEAVTSYRAALAAFPAKHPNLPAVRALLDQAMTVRKALR
ncbi:hypothetical protein OG455_33635 [Kitasatospora sp. NBC_01287]|uniref:hypothetical protein n=1 Tax=Kitasatospora sp. NBC_01287 TaxID=2903573 RepID=UPI002254F680|nr:hypothetical protein [Kitasatospora sp. NBC_01287]MCX4750396.1 hypothetical protein [Kitasatospora sp. NBC_01287]